jgi:transposase
VPNPIAVPASERPCPECGEERTCIAHETTEVAELIPAEVIVRQDIREVLACRKCDAEVVRAPMPVCIAVRKGARAVCMKKRPAERTLEAGELSATYLERE